MLKFQVCLHMAIIPLFVTSQFAFVYTTGACREGKCSASHRFAIGENMADGYVLIGHVFQNISVMTGVLNCYIECQSNCRCISFNFLTNVFHDNCQLNEENRHLQPDALKPMKGSQYYDLVIDYSVKTRASSSPCTQCTNRCCSDHPCLNGGTCQEICETNNKRFICHCPENVFGQLCQKDCRQALGMESGKILDGQITASSEYSENFAASLGRLLHDTIWSPFPADINQWLQVDLGIPNTYVTGVATQGESEPLHVWVKSYKLQYSNDTENFHYYKEQGQDTEMEFAGNTDQNTVVYRDLNPPITARYIRFVPVTWKDWISMRVELFGCQDI